MKAISQKNPMGCSVSCVASLCGISYDKALSLFKNKSLVSMRGYYCREICEALKKEDLNYTWKKITTKTKPLLKEKEVIVFISRSKKYPCGHFLLKTKKSWMDPWINFPRMNPVKAGFRKKLPGKPQWIMFPNKTKHI